jgi:hypothetical protein
MLIKDIEEIQGIVQQDLEKLGLYLCDYCECPNQEFDHHILHLQGKCGDCTTDLEFDIIEPTAEAIRLLQNPDNPW